MKSVNPKFASYHSKNKPNCRLRADHRSLNLCLSLTNELERIWSGLVQYRIKANIRWYSADWGLFLLLSLWTKVCLLGRHQTTHKCCLVGENFQFIVCYRLILGSPYPGLGEPLQTRSFSKIFQNIQPGNGKDPLKTEIEQYTVDGDLNKIGKEKRTWSLSSTGKR